MIQGIHHVSMKCENPDEIKRVKEFYLDVLGLQMRREWSDGFMIDTGNGLIEVFTNGDGEHQKGIIRHIAQMMLMMSRTESKQPVTMCLSSRMIGSWILLRSILSEWRSVMALWGKR